MDNTALINILGSKDVFEDSATLEAFSKDESMAPQINPRCVVKVKDVQEIQEVVKWANKTDTPLIPVSSGPPRFNGDSVPGLTGAVVMDLSQMKRIIRVDRKNRVTMIEPGVTYDDLIPALAEAGLAPFMPLLPRRSKSVLTGYLEKDPVTVPRYQWTAQDPLLDLEIIYGTGDLFRTGSAAGPGTIEEQWKVGRAQMRGMGPGQVNFARMVLGTQGTLGVVTWATIKCNVLPKKKILRLFSGDLEALIDFTYRFFRKKLGGMCFLVNAHNFACLLEKESDGIEALRSNLPEWIVVCSLEGGGVMPQEKVDYQEDEVMDASREFNLAPMSKIPGFGLDEIYEKFMKPSEEPYWKMRPKGGCHSIFFLTTLDKTPAFIGAVSKMAEEFQYPPREIGVYLQPIVQGTNCHCEFNLSYDPRNPEDADMIKRFDIEASKKLVEMGAFFNRPYGNWKDVAYADDPVASGLQKKIKDIFDPKGILNPNKLRY